MYYYLVDVIGSGTKQDPYRPDMPQYVFEQGFSTNQFSQTQVIVITNYEVIELASKQVNG